MTVEKFLEYLQYEKNKSPHTVIAYKSDLEQFSNFIQVRFSITNILDAKDDHIRDWIISLKENNYNATSINRKTACLRSFFKFCRKTNPKISNPLKNIVSQKTEKKLPIFFNTSDIDEALINDYCEFRSTLTDIIIELLFDTGIRRSELIGLKEADCNFKNRSIKVLGKGNKERIIPICESLKTKLENYIALKHKIIGYTTNLIVTPKGKPAYDKYIYRVVKNKMAETSTLEKRSPHVMRHSFASSLLNNNADINAVKTLLGHANLAATQVYTHTTFEQLKQVYKKSHPRN